MKEKGLNIPIPIFTFVLKGKDKDGKLIWESK